MKTNIQIKNRWTGSIIFEHECTTILDCLKEAFKKGANLRGAYLQGAYLQGAYLQGADLQGANLQGADLRGAYLQGAYLWGANLQGANLQGADLWGAYLWGANLQGANLQGADLWGANLQGANLQGADLQKWKHQIWIIPEEGSFTAWKKCQDNIIAKLQIPSKAKRTCNFRNRKCRAEYIKTLGLYDVDGNKLKGKTAIGKHDNKTIYEVGKITKADSFDDDLTNDCTNGIHFFVTKQEAINW